MSSKSPSIGGKVQKSLCVFCEIWRKTSQQKVFDLFNLDKKNILIERVIHLYVAEENWLSLPNVRHGRIDKVISGRPFA